jgi:putative flippase GtrA
MDHQDQAPRKNGLLGQLVRFNVVGAVNTAVTYALYAGLVALGVPALAALVADYALGIVLSFALNRKYTFDSSGGSLAAAFLRMVLSYLPLLGVNMVLLFALVHMAGWNEYFAQLVALGLVTALSFLVQKFFVFSQKGA